jgi:hypothetical protein
VTATAISPTTSAAPGSVAATLRRLEHEPWWPVIQRLPVASGEPLGQIMCLGHFLAWLDRNGLRVTDCTDEQLAAYETTLNRFRPRALYQRTAREFVRLAVMWRAGGARPV